LAACSVDRGCQINVFSKPPATCQDRHKFVAFADAPGVIPIDGLDRIGDASQSAP
jgi:hypothetical protein